MAKKRTTGRSRKRGPAANADESATAPADGAAIESAAPPEVTPEGGEAAPAGETGPRRGARRGGRGRRRAGRADANGAAEATHASEATPAATGRKESAAATVHVEEREKEVVIRFPPVGVPPRNIVAAPQAAPPPPARQEPPIARETPPPPTREHAPPPQREQRPHDRHVERTPHDRPPGRRGERQAHGQRGGQPDAPPRGRETAPPQRGGAAPPDENGDRLSPSQRRRERRRRRAQRIREARAGAPAALAPEATEPEFRAPPASPDVEAPYDEPDDAPTLFDADAPQEGALETALEDEADAVVEREESPREPRGRGAAPEAPSEPAERDGRGRRRRRRRDRFRERDDVAGATDAEFVAGEVGGEETTDLALDWDKEPEAEEEPERDYKPPTDLNVPAKREMMINIVPREESRIAILESGKLEEIYLERASAENHVGNIYKGVVTNVEASIQAAFIDFGLGKNGFLHISDLHPQYFPSGERQTENVGRKMPRRARPPIQRCLRRGQEMLVQITKEGIGTKGPTLTTYLAIPGRFLVMMPGMRRLGVSRKIEDDDIREKLRSLMFDLDLPEDMGFIARTAAARRTKRELQSDLNYLSRLWRAVDKRIKSERAPAELYRESDLVIRTIRDVFTSDIDRIVVDDHDVAERAREFLSIFSPRSRDAVLEYDGPTPLFHRYGIEAELERLHSRHVPLRSGGSLVIDQTEALVAIDVNSGRFRAEDDAEATAYKINCEAADEIPRQLRLRDMGGVIICDFIDMRAESHRREIERRLIRNLKQHKERAKVLRMSAFGIIEMTRQRQRASLTRSVYQDCSHCRGTGLVKTAESVVLDAMRLLQLAMTRDHVVSIEVVVSPEVALLLQNRKRAALHELELEHRRSVTIRGDVNFGLDQMQIHCYDVRGRLVPHN